MSSRNESCGHPNTKSQLRQEQTEVYWGVLAAILERTKDEFPQYQTRPTKGVQAGGRKTSKGNKARTKVITSISNSSQGTTRVRLKYDKARKLFVRVNAEPSVRSKHSR